MTDHHHMLQLISEGNELTFRRFYDHYSEMVYNTALGDKPLNEDNHTIFKLMFYVSNIRLIRVKLHFFPWNLLVFYS